MNSHGSAALTTAGPSLNRLSVFRFKIRGECNFAATRSLSSANRSRTDVVRNLVHCPQILIQPVQCFFDEFVAWDVVTGFVEQVFLLVFPRSQQPVERLLGRVNGKKEIVVSI